MKARTALLIRCSAREAERIRAQAASERRTISGYVLNILARRWRYVEAFDTVVERHPILSPYVERPQLRGPKLGGQLDTRTAVLVRCSAQEGAQIRATAMRRKESISGFVVESLWAAWNAQEAVAEREFQSGSPRTSPLR